MDFTDKILEYVSIFIALLVVLPFHEFAHGFAAVKSGDDTPKLYGRYTLNPFVHFEPLGLVCFVFAHFGWAKPMPVNPGNFKHYKRDCFFVAVAGVTMNYLLSFIAYPLLCLSIMYVPQIGAFTEVLCSTLFYIYWFGLTFFVFNLIPVYPLDGFRALDVFSKKRGPVYRFLRNYGMYILYALFALSVIADYTSFYQLDILGNFITYVADFIGLPIQKFWGLFF